MTANTFLLSLGLLYFDRQNVKWPTPALSISGASAGLYQQPVTVAPGDTLSVFSGARSISADSSTVFTMTLSPINVDPIYRFTWTAGTAPGLRVARAVDLSAQTVAVTLNANETVTVAASAGSFSSAAVGDNVFVPGVGTGDPAGPFSESNVGFWVVLSKDGTSSSVVLSRRAGESFSGVTESVLVSSAGQLRVFSSGPVQRGDSVDVVAGFTAPVLRSYVVHEVTATWFEVVASDPLPPSEVGTGGTPPAFYNSAKAAILVTVDQECALSVNGVSERVAPVLAGSVPGFYAKSAPVYSLSITNRSAQVLSARVVGV